MKGDKSMNTSGINAGIIASWSGTDANAIMNAYNIGFIPEIADLRLISTKSGAGCLAKAENQKIKSAVIECRNKEEVPDFNDRLTQYVKVNHIQLIILAGCVWELYPIEGVLMINIHPADTQKHGGRHMYGLKVHERVLTDVMDIIYREIKNPEDDFETCVTIHEVGFPIDQGPVILKANVKIPRDIVIGLQRGSLSLKDASANLQKHILEYEWILLPAGVRTAARKILDEVSQGR
jgi:phosphoribosylglycinamide formyltransferase-1